MSDTNKLHGNHSLLAEIEAVSKIPILPQILDVICGTTGMGFAAIARVTNDKWITCTSKDLISFGLKSGDELELETTLCQMVKESLEPVFIDHAEKDPDFADHHTPKIYGIESYISYPIIRKDGSFFGTLCAVDPNPSNVNTPEIKGMFKLFADLISFHLEAVDEIAEAAVQLKKEKDNAELREQFIAILGHDLRNPIATTKMSAEILLKISKEEMVQRQANTIKATSYRMEKLIENILDFANGRMGDGISLNLGTDNEKLEKTLYQIKRETATVSPQKKITFTINLHEAVNCDKERIGQLFSNLLSNAIAHGAEDSSIEVEAATKENKFILSVKNGGEKIPDSAIKHLFQPFYRKDIKPGKQGLGLGLFITSEIARAHGGKMHVSSTEKETCFTFTMPLTSSAEGLPSLEMAAE